MKTFVVIAALLLAVGAHGWKTYDGQQVWRLHAENAEQFLAVTALLEREDADVWMMRQSTLEVDVRVDLVGMPTLVQELKALRVPSTVYVSDLAEVLPGAPPVANASAAVDFFADYRSSQDIRLFAQQLVEKNSALATFVPSIGKTYNGQDIFAVRLGDVSNSSRRVVYLQGGIHAREWVSPSTVMYILNSLLESTDARIRSLVDQIEFVIVPQLNVDGYDWTRSNDRLWRKNRRVNSGSTCVGVDLNRNWDDHFGGGGSSSTKCSDTYRGTAAFSEPEAKAAADYIVGIAKEKEVIAGVDFHSYGQLLLHPYGWVLPTTSVPANDKELISVGAAMQKAILASSGKAYTNEHSAELYVAAGGSDDWFYSVLTKSRLAYCIELRDLGDGGFVLPPAQIVPTGEEALQAILTLAEYSLTRAL